MPKTRRLDQGRAGPANYSIQGKGLLYKLKALQLQVVFVTLFIFTPSIYANPVLNNASPGVSIQQTATTTTVNQTSQNAIINWHNFNIASGEKTQFIQPNSSSVALNRIDPNQGVSQIFGQLTANGQIILVNQSGIFFGPGARVDVAGLIATTANISNANFLSGNYLFDQIGLSGATITNAGLIRAAEHGLIALVGNNVKNDGTIIAHGGNVILASGATFVISLDNSGLISFVSNEYARKVGNGMVELTQQDAQQLVDQVVNLSGIQQASYAAEQNGDVILSDSSIVDVSGESGGTALILAANKAEVSGNILANATGAGNGGFIETSGNILDISGIQVNTTALHGSTGMWLLDPADITIQNNSGVNSNESFSGTTYSPTSGAAASIVDISLLTTQLGSSNVTITTTNAGTSGAGAGNITVANAITWSSANTLTLNAARNIYLNANITATNGGLVLNARSAATDAQSITSGSEASPSVTGVTADINVANFDITSGGWYQVNSTLPTFSIGNNFQLNSGNGANSAVQFILALSGDGTLGSPYLIADVYGLQGIDSNSTTLSNSWQLNNHIDASTTTNWNSGAGFVPIGSTTTNFTGTFDGQYKSVRNLFINLPLTAGVGLIGNTSGADISNIMVIDTTIYARNQGGALVGYLNNNSTLTQSAAINPTIIGTPGVSANFGGLVGLNDNGSSISNSYVQAGSVLGYNSVAGFTSYNVNGGSSITNSYSTARVTETNNDGAIGGFLVTNFDSTDTNNYWNSDTAGTGQSGGGNALNNSQMQSQTNFSNWDFANIWRIIEGVSYPYLKEFYSGTPRVISGTVVDASDQAIVGQTVQLANENTNISNSDLTYGATQTGANGFYYFIEPNGAIGDGNPIFAYTSGNGVLANSITRTPSSPTGGSVTGLNLKTNTVTLGDDNTNTFSNSLFNNVANNSAVSGSSNYIFSTNFASAPDVQISLYSDVNFVSTTNTTFNFSDHFSGSGSGTFTFNGPVTNDVFPDLNFNNTITSGGNQIYNSSVSLLSFGSFTFTSSNGSLVFNSTIDGKNLTLTATNSVTLAGVIGGTNALTSLDVTGSSIALNTTGITTTGAQTYNSPVTLGASGVTTLTSTGGSGITFSNTVNGTQGLAIADDSGNITFNNTVGATSALASLTIGTNNPTTLNGNLIRTTGNQTWKSTLTETADTILNLVTGSFTNEFGANLLTPFSGNRFLVWSTNPASDARNSIAYDFKQYAATYGVTSVIGSGNGFLYTIAPTITPSLIGTVSKIYNGNTTATLTSGNYTFSGAADDDIITLNTPTTGTYDNKNVGTGKTVSVTGISANISPNIYGYTVTSSASGAVGTITASPLTITASAQSKTYGATLALGTTAFTTGTLYNSDAVSSVTLTSGGAVNTASVAGSPYTITPSAAIGTGLSNYAITYTNGSLTVNPAALTITANSISKTYGQTIIFAGTEFSSSGLINSDNISSVTLTSSGAANNANVTGSPYSIVPSAPTGGTFNINNYTVTYNNGNLTINPAALTITANSISKTYGQTITFAGTEFSSSGLVNSDNISSVTLTSSGAANNANVTGSPYTIMPSAAIGAGLSNYTITYTNSSLTVNPAALTVQGTLAGNNKVFDNTTTATLNTNNASLSGIVNNDNVIISYIANFANIGPGLNIPINAYIVLAGIDAANYYLFSQPSNLNTLMANISSTSTNNPDTSDANIISVITSTQQITNSSSNDTDAQEASIISSSLTPQTSTAITIKQVNDFLQGQTPTQSISACY